MLRSSLTAVLTAALVAGAVSAPPAGAAMLRIGGPGVTAAEDGTIAVTLANPGRRTARGSLTLMSGDVRIAKARFRVPAGGARRLTVGILPAGMLLLAARETLAVRAVATARGLRPGRRVLRLRSPLGSAPAAAWRDGRWQGADRESNADLAFNLARGRIFTGPFDAFFLTATCRNVDPGYRGPDQQYTNANAIEPVAAAIASDGTFAGEGTYRSGSTPPIAWKLVGRVRGESMSGELSAGYTDVYGNPCFGVTRFEARWYGSYEL